MRTIGFNPRLRLNDGLLTQSVMEVEGTNYGDAQKMVIRWVNLLKEKLYEEGSVELANVGQLRMSIRGTMDFVPYNSRITTSWLYGLGSFEMPLLSEKSQRSVQPGAADEGTYATREQCEPPSADPRHTGLDADSSCCGSRIGALLLLLYAGEEHRSDGRCRRKLCSVDAIGTV